MAVQTFNFGGPNPGAQPNPAMLAQLAQALGGTSAMPAVQHSEELANQLSQLQQTGGQDIKSPLALGGNLLAEALLQYGRHKSNSDLMKQVQAGQSHQLQAAASGTGLDSQGNPITPTAPVTGTAQPGPVASAGPSPFGPPPSPTLADALQPPGATPPASTAGPQAQMFADLVKGGLSPVAASGLVGNMVGESGPNLDRSNPAEGAIGAANWEGPRGKAAQAYFDAHGGPSIDNQAAFTLSELKGPESRASHLLANAVDPQSAAAAALAYERPAGWTPHGDPSVVSGWNNRLAGAQSAFNQYGQAPAPQQAQAAPPPAPGGPAPYQVASNGPTPPPPGMPPQGASMPPQGGPPPMQGQPAPQAPPQMQGPPTGPQATPQEAAMIRQGLSFPQGSAPWNAALAQMQEIRQRAATPTEAPKDMYWSPEAHTFVPKPGTQFSTVASGPAGLTQSNPFGQLSSTSNPNAGAIPGGMMAVNGPNGPQVTPMVGTQLRPLTDPKERAAAGIQPYDRNAYAMAPNGDVKKTADDAFGPSAQLDYTTKIQALEPYKNYVAARQNVDSIRQLMAQPGGFNDLAIIENTGKTINPSIAIRPNMIEQYGKEVGFPDWLTGQVSSVMNHGGHLTAEGRNALYNTANANLQSHWNALQPVLGKVDYDAKKYGVTRQDLLPDLQPMMPAGSPSYPGASVPGANAPSSPNGNANSGSGNAGPAGLFGGQSGGAAPTTGGKPQTKLDPAHRAAMLQELRRAGVIQ